jgi:predicted metalloenzyme YecM
VQRYIEMLERVIRQLERELGDELREQTALVISIRVLEQNLARRVKGQHLERDPLLGPELPNGEGIAPPDPPTLGGRHHGGL